MILPTKPLTPIIANFIVINNIYCSLSFKKKSSSTLMPKYFAIRNAKTVEGTNLARSIELIVWRDTFKASAKSA
jgi:hypothetical protein